METFCFSLKSRLRSGPSKQLVWRVILFSKRRHNRGRKPAECGGRGSNWSLARGRMWSEVCCGLRFPGFTLKSALPLRRNFIRNATYIFHSDWFLAIVKEEHRGANDAITACISSQLAKAGQFPGRINLTSRKKKHLNELENTCSEETRCLSLFDQF